MTEEYLVLNATDEVGLELALRAAMLAFFALYEDQLKGSGTNNRGASHSLLGSVASRYRPADDLLHPDTLRR